MNWTYKHKEIETISDFPENTHGFVYRITHKPSGKTYIGKKVLYYERNKRLGKKELIILKEERKGIPGRLPTKKKVITESNWPVYWGSNKPLLKLVKNEPEDNFEKEILKICSSKKMLTYYETEFLFNLKVLHNSDKFFNDNILGKFYTKDFEA